MNPKPPPASSEAPCGLPDRTRRVLRLLPRQRAALVILEMQAKRCAGPCVLLQGECFLTKIGQPGMPSAGQMARKAGVSRETVRKEIAEALAGCHGHPADT